MRAASSVQASRMLIRSQTALATSTIASSKRFISTQMLLTDFSKFHVPASLIAQSPAFPRDSSKLMVVRRETGTIEHHYFRDLPKLLDSSYLIVANNSKVVNCKLLPLDKTGKTLVVYMLKQLSADRWLVSGDDELESKAVGFEVFIGREGRTIVGTLLQMDGDGSLEMVFRYDASSAPSGSSSSNNVSSSSSSIVDLKNDLQAAASIPLPPYIEAENAIKVSDQSYQTVYAVEDGSVAAPTAGLHFTPEVFAALSAKGVERTELTLHVGYGTFGHVTENVLSNHKMHSESYTLSDKVAQTINRHKLKSSKNKVLTVGTTSTRVLESCAALRAGSSPDKTGVLSNAEHTSRHEMVSGSGETNIFIYPPYQFKMVDALLTNFHMPGLTPVMLVSSFAGHALTMKAYEEAVKEKYRFYSFGDAMLIL